MIEETIDFDNAIGVALDFAENDGETLVIVTADHETGGYTLNRNRDDSSVHEAGFSTGYHTASLVPIFSYGPHAETLSGIHDITDIGKKMFELFGEPIQK